MIYSVFCDGSSGGNSTGAIGWGWVIMVADAKGAPKRVLLAGSGGARIGTNNIAELMAAREGLKALVTHPRFLEDVGTQEIELVSDSQYVLGLAGGNYHASKNALLADHVRDICLKYNIKTRWVRGHAGDPVNEMCDRLAKLGKNKYTPAKVTKRQARKARRRKMRK